MMRPDVSLHYTHPFAFKFVSATHSGITAELRGSISHCCFPGGAGGGQWKRLVCAIRETICPGVRLITIKS